METNLKEKEKQKDQDEEVTINVVGSDNDKETFLCQKCLLMNQSDYFNAMFMSGMVESHKNTVEIKDVDLDVMRHLIGYIKTGSLKLSGDNVYSITEGACRFQIKGAIEECCNFLEQNLSHETCPAALECSMVYHLEDLQKIAKRHMQHYFRQVSKTEEFLSLEVSTIKSILSEKALNVSSELDVYLAVEKWVDSDRQNRLQYLNDLLNCIHVEDILDCSNNMPDLKYLKMSIDNGRKEKKCSSTRKKFRSVPEDLLCVGLTRCDDTYALSFDPKVYKIDFNNRSSILKDNAVTTLENVRENNEGHGGYSVCLYDGKDIIVSGGEAIIGRNTWDKGVYCYDTFTKKWRTVTYLKTARRHHASCAINSCIFFIGGFGRFRVRLSSMEKYDFETDDWTSLAPSPTHGLHSAVTVLHDNIYALFCDSAMFCYKPTQDIWTKIQISNDVSKGIAFLGAYTYNDKIYVRASRDVIQVLEYQDEKTFKLTKTCINFSKDDIDSLGSHVFGVAISNNIMYCFKSDDGTGYLTDIFEMDLIGTSDTRYHSERLKEKEDKIETMDVRILMQNQVDLISVPHYF